MLWEWRVWSERSGLSEQLEGCGQDIGECADEVAVTESE